MDNSKCVILVPFGSHIEPECAGPLTELERRGYAVRRVSGYAAIDQGRSQMATDALADGFDELMWIDSDIGFDPSSVDRLRAHGLPLVSAIYPKKGQRALASCLNPETSEVTFGEGGGLLEIAYAAAGFLLTRREVYQSIHERLGLPLCNQGFGRPLVPYFLPLIVPHEGSHWYLGEDYAFCARAKQVGYKIMADTQIRLRHIGRYGFSWEDAGGELPRYPRYAFHVAGKTQGAPPAPAPAAPVPIPVAPAAPEVAEEARIPFEHCPLCEAREASEILVADCSRHPLYRPGLPKNMHWVRCDTCSHVFVDGYFGERALSLLFSGAHDFQTPGHDPMNGRATAARIVEEVARLAPRREGRWLDVGFGDGSLLSTALEFGCDVVGLDLRASHVERMKKNGIEAHAMELTDFEAAKPFDVISMADVLEHMPFPRAALKHAHKLVSPGGMLFVSMPNIDAPVWKTLDDDRRNPYWGEIEHLHNFGRRRLYALLRESGFEPCHYGISQRYVACMEVIARKV